MGRIAAALTWCTLIAAIAVPVIAASMSPLLAWRQPVYIASSFAGIAAMALILFQPLLARSYLPGIALPVSRRIHRWVGALLVAAVVIHIGGLWITSPPDVIDALTLTSPTPFSVWGVLAMWCVFAAAGLAAFRRKLALRPRTWRIAHMTLVAITVAGSVAHALLIEGAMETISKVVLCALVVIATLVALAKR